jgi:hypothetical protein
MALPAKVSLRQPPGKPGNGQEATYDAKAESRHCLPGPLCRAPRLLIERQPREVGERAHPSGKLVALWAHRMDVGIGCMELRQDLLQPAVLQVQPAAWRPRAQT